MRKLSASVQLVTILFSLLITACALRSSPKPAAIEADDPISAETPLAPSAATAEAAEIDPSIMSLVVNAAVLEAKDGVFSFEGVVNPGDQLVIKAVIRDDEDGTFGVLGNMAAYSPEDNSAEAAVMVSVPSELMAAELPVFLGEERAGVIIFTAGSEWAPVITVENPTGLTGDVVLEVMVTDLNGHDTIESLTVEQEFNFQDSGDKAIREYISNSDIGPIEITKQESGLYVVGLQVDLPARIPLLFSATDADGNNRTIRIPLEIMFRQGEHPLEYRGFAISLWGDPQIDWQRQDMRLVVPSLRQMHEDYNANLVMFFINGAVDTVSSNEIKPCYELPANDRWCLTPNEAELRSWIRAAHEEGLQVMLVPTPFGDHWQYEMYQLAPSDWSIFFESYAAFVLDLARIAESQQVEMIAATFAHGDHVSRHDGDYRKLVAEMRDIFSGMIVVQSFWPYPPLFDVADVIGLHYFYGTTDLMDPTQEEMYFGFQHWMDGLVKPVWQEYRKPILFTELGVYNIDGSGIEPLTTWQRFEDPSIDNQEQVDYYDAALRTITEQSGVVGTIVWAYPTSARQIEFKWFAEDAPVRDLVRIWYSQE